MRWPRALACNPHSARRFRMPSFPAGVLFPLPFLSFSALFSLYWSLFLTNRRLIHMCTGLYPGSGGHSGAAEARLAGHDQSGDSRCDRDRVGGDGASPGATARRRRASGHHLHHHQVHLTSPSAPSCAPFERPCARWCSAAVATASGGLVAARARAIAMIGRPAAPLLTSVCACGSTPISLSHLVARRALAYFFG